MADKKRANFPLIDDNDPDLKRLEDLAKRLAEEDFSLSSLLARPAAAASSLQQPVATNDQDIEASLLEEFRALAASQATDVPRARLKQLYLNLLLQGDTLLSDRTAADAFLGKLAPAEMDGILSLMQREPEQVVQFFDGDLEVVEAMKKTRMARLLPQDPQLLGLGPDASSAEWEKIEKELLQSVSARVASQQERPPAVVAALRAFEGNMAHYAQRPEDLMTLCNTLPTPREQNEFLDVLFSEYTPDKIQERLKTTASTGPQNGPSAVSSLPPVSHELVAAVFKEVLCHFRAFKKNPRRFDPLVERLNASERAQLDALIQAFWDVPAESLKM
jgi:hypothetical protein